MKNIVSISDLYVYFDSEQNQPVINGINIDIPAGKVTALIGASGSGKSITSLALMGLLPDNASVSGAITFNNNNLLNNTKEEWQNIRGKDISMIFQEPMSALNPLISVGKQIMEVVVAHYDISHKQAKEKVIDWMRKVQLPDVENTYHKYPHQLSGGQKQRVMIAMAMINEPKLIIADEPTTALDILVQQEIIFLLKDLQVSFSTSILFITHDISLAQDIADVIIEMNKGKVVSRTLQPQVTAFKTIENNNNKTILKVENVTIDYFNNGLRTRAVDNVSFDLKSQEILGLVGGSGCGKTTISKAILGLVKISSGSIWYDGTLLQEISANEWRKLRSQIQIIFQDPYAALNPRIKIGDAIAEPIIVHHKVNKSRAKENVYDLLRSVNLREEDYDKYPHEFSGGQRQRICIARALALRPKLIICDESVAALDINVRDQVLDLLVSIQQREKLSYIFITHDMNVVKRICDRVVVMETGRIVEMGDARDIISKPQHEYTKRLTEAAFLV